MTDPLVQRLDKLETHVQRFEGLRGEDLSDPYTRAALERFFQLAAEASLDVGEMLVAREGLDKPETYRHVIRTLADAGGLPPAFAERFEDAAGFRNVLVHGSTDVRTEELEANLDRLDDVRAFAEHVLHHLDGEPEAAGDLSRAPPSVTPDRSYPC
jgi:uncharacterized protein YutE (UPF0331/DUF86 family)